MRLADKHAVKKVFADLPQLVWEELKQARKCMEEKTLSEVSSNINRPSGEVRCLRESCLEVEKGKGGKEGKAVGGGGGILLLSF